MKNHLLKRILSLLLVVALLAGYYVPGVQAAPIGLSWKETDQKIKLDLTDRGAETYVEEAYAPTDIVRVSIVLEEKSTIQAGYNTRNIARNDQAMAYSRSLRAKQDTLSQTISAQALGGQKLDVVWNLTLVGNIISANVPYGKIPAIAKVAGVRDVFVENVYEPCVVERNETVANPQMYASIGMVGSSLVWSGGYTGAGSRIAVLDTGTDTNHQSLDGGAYLYALEQNALAAGVSYEEYLGSLNLLDAWEIASVLTDLNIYEKDSSITAAKLYLNQKLPFAVNYVDNNSYRYVVDHENANDQQGEHGSHVAGIATANRYIPNSSGGYDEAMETVLMAGMAPDAQLITMKVFGIRGGPSDSDYMAAVEDAILLGCDAVNLSLGSSVSDTAENSYYADLLEYMTRTDTVVVASAGNSYSWPVATTFGYLYSDDVSLDTVGSPGSYSSFFTVASVENDGSIIRAFKVADKNIEYSDGTYGRNNPMSVLDTSANLSGTDYEYVFIDGLGYEEDYAGINLEGKIVFCSRGDTNFSTKAEIALSRGAVATVIYNNEPGNFGMDLRYYYYTVPCASISQADADIIRAASNVRRTSDGMTYYTGTMTVLGKQIGMHNNSEYYTMNDFSSWGVPGDLSLKPEITAPGGNIYSLNGENYYGGGPDQYELMSGTSMSAPAVTGMVALLAQYLRETGLAGQEGMHVRTLAQSLLMSTAVPMVEEASGSYYSLLKQGAGLARVDLATSADSYILVDGQSDGKVKAELGDDPNRTGVYEFSFTINNLTDRALSYALSAELFRQGAFESSEDSGISLLDTWTTSLPGTAIFTANGQTIGNQDLSGYDLNGDGSTNAEDADYLLEYLLGNETTLHGEGDVSKDGNTTTYDAHVLLTLLNSDGMVQVPAGGSVDIRVRLTLTASAKALLDETYANGTYVEAFVYAESVTTEEGVAGTCHSIPVLAFYGNWSDPNMFDYGTHVELMHDYEGPVPYLYQIIDSGNALTIDYGDGDEFYFGGNPIARDDSFLPERNAFNSQDSSYLYGQYYTLLRNATGLWAVITNAETGEVYYQKNLDKAYPAYYNVNYGNWDNVQQFAYLGWSGTDASGAPLPEDIQVDVSLVAVPEYYRNADGTHNLEGLGDGVYLTTSMTIDNTAPQVLDMELVDTTLTVSARDNRHVAAVMLLNSSGTTLIAAETPNQVEKNVEISVDLNLTNVIGETFLLAVCDYALNQTVYEVTLELPEVERPYFTVVDYPSNTYYGVNMDGSYILLASGDRGTIYAAEFVDGYVFEIAEGSRLYVASDSDLNSFRFLSKLDPTNSYLITNFLDLAYNKANNTLYGLFYSDLNAEITPYLCTIDMFDGTMEVLAELPVDVINLAVDGRGNFYSVAYREPSLYTYTLQDLNVGIMDYVGEIGYYYTNSFNSLAWDQNTGTLFWAYPNTMLQVDPRTAEPTLLSYVTFQMTGLYIRPETYGDQFASTNAVSHLTIDQTESRTLVGQTLALTAQVWPWNVTDGSVSWRSSDERIATVDATGLVAGHSVGTAVITATSNLDPTKSISCTMEVMELNKTLNGIVWDEAGDMWWSEFNLNSLPSYTKLTTSSNEEFLASAAFAPDGTLYAASIDLSTGYIESSLYTVNPRTFEATEIGRSSYGYTDIAYAPHLLGGSILGTYGNYLLVADPETGDMVDYYDMWYNSLIAVAYAGSTRYQEYDFDTYIDWCFLVDNAGYVYLMGFLTDDYGNLYYFEHPATTGGIFTVISHTSDVSYFSAAHYDGEFLYLSLYNSGKNLSTMLAIDTMGNRKAYEMGNFGNGVWPVGALVELDNPTSGHVTDVAMTLEPKAVEETPEPVALSASAYKDTVPAAVGGLNAAGGTVPTPVLRSAGEFSQEDQEVTVTLTPACDSPNGKMTVTYDPDALSLTGVTGYTEAFAYTAGDGTVTVAFASAAILEESQSVATLTFEVLTAGEHTVTVAHAEAGETLSNKQETLTISCGCAHSYQTVVTAPTCQSQGYTTYTCANCGDSYVGDYTDPVDHVYVGGYCQWCGEEQRYVRWYSGTTSLNGTIDLNIYVLLSEDLVSAEDTFVRFLYAGKTVDVPMADALNLPMDGHSNCYRFSCPMYAKQLADKVTITFMKGDEVIGDTLSYSVMTYCVNQIRKSTNADTVALCKALLNYGAAAQQLLNYNTDNLANTSLNDADKVLANVDASAYKYSLSGSEPGITATSATLMLEDVVKVRVYFTLTGDKSIGDYTFTIDGQEVAVFQNEEGYYVETEGIPAKDLEKMFTVQVGGITVTYGALSYVNSKAGGSNELASNIAKALYAYWQAAETLLG